MPFPPASVRDVRSTFLLFALAFGPLVACGARSGNTTDAEQAIDCLPQAVRGVVGTSGPGTCVLEGRDADGRRHRMECSRDPEICVWFTDGTERCRCAEPDWANTCANSVPICVGWNLPFDFADDVTFK